MALKIHTRLFKFVEPPITEFIAAYLRAIDGYGASRGLQSSFWQPSAAALSDPKKGRISATNFLDQTTEHILYVEEFPSNCVVAMWTLRDEAQEHSFKLKLVLSQIPHFWIDFLESSYEAGGSEALSNHGDKLKALECGLADVVLSHGDLLGYPHRLYVYLKVMRSKKLSKRFSDVRWSGEHVLEPMTEAATRGLGLPESEPTLSARKATRSFLESCDERLLRNLGEERFGAVIAQLGLSLSEWKDLR